MIEMVRLERTEKEVTLDPYQELANAVVALAIQDLKVALNAHKMREYYRLKEFFLSDWFSILSDLDGEKLLKMIEGRVK